MGGIDPIRFFPRIGKVGLRRQDLIKACTTRDFWLKLLVLELLKSSSEGRGIADIPVDLMRQVAGERNHLAHGHFDQNPFDGSYEVVAKNVRAEYSVERLDGLTAKAEKVSEALRHASAFYAFSDTPAQ